MYHDHYNIDKIGKIGLVLQTHFYYPKDPQKPEDVEAADRMIQFWVTVTGNILHQSINTNYTFQMGQYSHPIFSKTGGYPKIMVDVIRNNSLAEGLSGSRLPVITEHQKNLIRGTSDYFFLNYYSSAYAEFANATTARNFTKPSLLNDANVLTTQDVNWPVAASVWLRSIPDGLRKLLK